MSNSDTRKSMDDVLASIRRIVRAEKEPEDAVQPETDAAPETDGLTRPDQPLELTPDMRMHDQAAAAAPAADPVDPPMPAPGLDEGAIRELIRQVLQEELSNGGADPLIRAVIRDELTKGSTGSNISKNVLRLVRAEIQKATG